MKKRNTMVRTLSIAWLVGLATLCAVFAPKVGFILLLTFGSAAVAVVSVVTVVTLLDWILP